MATDKPKVWNTDIEIKRENWDKFAKLIENQWEHGGDKYKLTEGKEVTDLICEAFPGDSGVDFILSNIMKYTMRFKNFKREKDLLKISAYCFIAWLKTGNHLKEGQSHDEDIRK